MEASVPDASAEAEVDTGSRPDAGTDAGADAATDAPVEAGAVDPGFVWHEIEEAGNCHGLWTRQGTTSSFSSVWPDCAGTTAVMVISIVGTSVTAQRTLDSGGNDCTYTGTLGDGGTSVTGTYHCQRYQPPAPGAWSATIDYAPPDAGADAVADAPWDG